jgi:hypothetical protein
VPPRIFAAAQVTNIHSFFFLQVSYSNLLKILNKDACVHDASCGDEEEQVASSERLSDEDRQLLKAILLSQKHHN